MEEAKRAVIVAGWLGKMKRGPKLLARWNKRWVSIENDSIQWRHAKGGDIAGKILILDIDKVYRLNSLKAPRRGNGGSGNSNNKNNGSTVLIVKSKKRNLCLMARSAEDCQRWVRAIQMQLDLKEGGTASGPRCQRNRRLSNGGGDKYTKLFQAAQSIETEIPSSIEGSFDDADANISDLDATFASASFYDGITLHGDGDIMDSIS